MGKRLVAVTAAVAMGAAVLVGSPGEALAGTGLYYQAVDSDNDPYSGIYLRNGTGMANVTRIGSRYMYYGNTVELVCGAWGEAVGPYVNRRWHSVRVIDGPAAGQQGWIADRYLNTPNKANQATPGEPECGSAPAPQSVPPANKYNGAGAADWALRHAKDVQPYDASCTWFVSNALWWGARLGRTNEWTDAGVHGRLQPRPGSVAAWAVPNFVSYMRKTYPASTWTKLDFTRGKNAVPQAAPGDVIIYDWDGNGTYDHATLVVSISSGQYPNVAEWGIVKGGEASPYNKRGWTYSELRHEWLQVKYPKVKAYLLHIVVK